MNAMDFSFAGAQLRALPSGALHWPEHALLVVSDLHLGKSDRIARRNGNMLPPYETRDTLLRLDADIAATAPETVLCLGDSFDDPVAAASLSEEDRMWITRLQAGRSWIWIEGNHDPGGIGLGGSHRETLTEGPLTFRHIARTDANGEVSGHYHPKVQIIARGRMVSRRCFLIDQSRMILPAYGTFTGGLRTTDKALTSLMGSDAEAILVGDSLHRLPMPR
ncbi:MAG: ligase-associated DNA damage response endonuclease PdeM [Pseudomonadota bacterium]